MVDGNQSGEIRAITSDDTAAVMAIATAIDLFEPGEAEAIGGLLEEYFAGTLGEGHTWIVLENFGIAGVAYFAPEQFAEGTWNVYFIAVHPDRQREGNGANLLTYVEQHLSAQGERLLLVETSGLPALAAARAFYRKQGYEEEARIREFYSAGDDKIIFRKALVS